MCKEGKHLCPGYNNYYVTTEYIVKTLNKINEKFSCGDTPLTCSVNTENTKLVQYLVKKGADITIKGKSGTPLSVAMLKNNLEIINILLLEDANINKIYHDGNTPLALSLQYKQLEIAKTLINRGANVNKVGKNGRTPLSWAVHNQDLNMIKWLLNNGAQFTIHSALFDAILTKNFNIFQLLINKGALVNSVSKEGDTPLMKCIEMRNYEMVKVLIEKGVNVNMIGSKCGYTPLTKSIQTEHFEMTKYLLEKGADPNQVDKNGNTPSAIAASNYDLRTCKCLIDAGADINVVISEIEKISNDSVDASVYLEILKVKIKKNQNKHTKKSSLSGSGHEEA